MGAWGCRTFENDDASDWLYELYESDDFSIVEAALKSVTSGGYLEAPDCCNALAAAEVVAALNNKPASSLPKELISWLSSVPTLIEQIHLVMQAGLILIGISLRK